MHQMQCHFPPSFVHHSETHDKEWSQPVADGAHRTTFLKHLTLATFCATHSIPSSRLDWAIKFNFFARKMTVFHISHCDGCALGLIFHLDQLKFCGEWHANNTTHHRPTVSGKMAVSMGRNEKQSLQMTVSIGLTTLSNWDDRTATKFWRLTQTDRNMEGRGETQTRWCHFCVMNCKCLQYQEKIRVDLRQNATYDIIISLSAHLEWKWWLLWKEMIPAQIPEWRQ